MIAEAIDRITELADSKKPERLHDFADETVYAAPTAAGGWEVFTVKRQPTKPRLSFVGVEDAIAWAEKGADPETAVWLLDKRGVSIIINRDDKQTLQASVAFQVSAAWAYLFNPDWKTRREFVAFMRRNMPFLPSPFAASIRNLKIEKSTETESETTASSVAMGNRFKVKASGATDLPESVALAFKPFFNIDHGVNVMCVFEIDFEQGKIRLAPIDGNLARVHESIRTQILEANDKWLVVSGTAS